MKSSAVKSICICSICIALCYVLPLAFHATGLGSMFSPLHIPVLLCGLICGGWYGMFCGIAGPILSSILSGMPPAVGLITMIPELTVYGFVSGLCMKWIRTGHLHWDIYISLVSAMVLGRIAGGIAKVLFYLGTESRYGITTWVSVYVVGSLPGIIVQLILLPVLVFLLMKTGVIPYKYPGKARRNTID